MSSVFIVFFAKMIGGILEGLSLGNVAQTLQNVSFRFQLMSCTKPKRRGTTNYNEAMDYTSAIILTVLLGLIPAMIAYHKGYTFWKWWMFGAVLFIVALPIIIFLAPAQEEKAQVEVNGMKKCLYCAEMVRAETIVCQFCGHDLVVSAGLDRPEGMARFLDHFRIGNIQKNELFQGMIFMAIVLLILAMMLLMLTNLNY